MKNTVTHCVLAGALLGVPLAARARSPPPTQTFMDGFAGGTPHVGLAGGYSLLQNIKVEPREGPLGAGPAQERWGNGIIGAGLRAGRFRTV